MKYLTENFEYKLTICSNYVQQTDKISENLNKNNFFTVDRGLQGAGMKYKKSVIIMYIVQNNYTMGLKTVFLNFFVETGTAYS